MYSVLRSNNYSVLGTVAYRPEGRSARARPSRLVSFFFGGAKAPDPAPYCSVITEQLPLRIPDLSIPVHVGAAFDSSPTTMTSDRAGS